MNSEFKSYITENKEEQLIQLIKNNGKKPKPVSPIYYFKDLPEEERIKVEEEYSINVKT